MLAFFSSTTKRARQVIVLVLVLHNKNGSLLIALALYAAAPSTPCSQFHVVIGNRRRHDLKRWTLNLPSPIRPLSYHPLVPRAQAGTNVEAGAPVGSRNSCRWQLSSTRGFPVSLGTTRSGVGELRLRTLYFFFQGHYKQGVCMCTHVFVCVLGKVLSKLYGFKPVGCSDTSNMPTS